MELIRSPKMGLGSWVAGPPFSFLHLFREALNAKEKRGGNQKPRLAVCPQARGCLSLGLFALRALRGCALSLAELPFPRPCLASH